MASSRAVHTACHGAHVALSVLGRDFRCLGLVTLVPHVTESPFLEDWKRFFLSGCSVLDHPGFRSRPNDQNSAIYNGGQECGMRFGQ